MLRLVSLPLWEAVSDSRRKREFEAFPQLRRHWQHLQAKKATSGAPPAEATATAKGKGKGKKRPRDDAAAATAADAAPESSFVPSLVRDFVGRVEAVPGGAGELEAGLLRSLERFVELLVDLLVQLPTRRFLRTFLLDAGVLERCELSALATARADGALFGDLVAALKKALHFEINDQTGLPLTRNDAEAAHHTRLHALQRTAHKHHKDTLATLAFASSKAVGERGALEKHLVEQTDAVLADLCQRTHLGGGGGDNRALCTQALLNHFAERQSALVAINQMPLYPNEAVLWDANTMPADGSHLSEKVLVLPKLNLQFLTFDDYLLRSFELYRLESAYGIRADLVDAIKRVKPRRALEDGATRFTGWARMAAPAVSVVVDEVKPPKLGEFVPAAVLASVTISLTAFSGHIRGEWEELREHDVLFLAGIDAAVEDVSEMGDRRGGLPVAGGDRRAARLRRDAPFPEEHDPAFPQKVGVTCVRGCEVLRVLDETGHGCNELPQRHLGETHMHHAVGDTRVLKVALDPAQYYADVRSGTDPYPSLNLVVRRDGKENNFKSVLDTIRDLMNTAAVGKAVPPWLHDVLLGYGDPSSAHYRHADMAKYAVQEAVDFRDTFVDAAHVAEAFPGKTVAFKAADGTAVGADAPPPPPPYRLSFAAGNGGGADGETVTAQAYTRPDPGPFPEDRPRRNGVRFTPMQVEAVRAGMHPGLALVVGPPGTGKTDVAVQTIANLYRAFPNQRILLVAHSNAALNDLFEKILERDVEPRHLLRLGSGEKALAGDIGASFSKAGRVAATLAARIELLDEVGRLAQSLGVAGDVGATCETAAFFALYHVRPRIAAFEAAAAGAGFDAHAAFPFAAFFATAPGQPLFGKGAPADVETARGCFRHVERVFAELADYRAFELLRNQRHRSDYLLLKQARIIAMTCTHAALKRRELVELGFKYDTLVMEEAAQVLEVETFIPMLLQDLDVVEGCRLKRVMLIGDHHQLPPVVQNSALQKYSHLDQSLFARFVRLGTPVVQLDMQGRARPSLADLYRWRYKALGDLKREATASAFSRANPGMAHDYQLVDVPDFMGNGETTPTPHFYQNLGEAEYVVATYMYLRLCGHPRSSIAILTTYNGQLALLRDVLAQRCADPMFGMPGAVSTVDKFQGQQADIVLLSLVRTKAVGHVRDVRRLVVAVSRARLGLYVFCRKALFETAYVLTPVFNQLLKRPPVLQLALGERVGGAARPLATAPPNLHPVQDVKEMGLIVHQIVQSLTAQQAAAAAIPPPPPPPPPPQVTTAEQAAQQAAAAAIPPPPRPEPMEE